MQLKVKRKNLLTDALYVLFVLCYLMVLLIWGMGSSFSQIRYYILMFATVVAGFDSAKKNYNLWQKFTTCHTAWIVISCNIIATCKRSATCVAI